MKRGEIWSIAGGVYTSKPRPAVIIRDDAFATLNSVTVIPLTSTAVEHAGYLRVAIEPHSDSGLTTASFAMIDKISSVRRSHVSERIGRVTESDLLNIERSLLVFLGMAR